MKIKKIKFTDHGIFGNLELDFMNPKTKKAFNTIIIAGENGVGKTKLLEIIEAQNFRGESPLTSIDKKYGGSCEIWTEKFKNVAYDFTQRPFFFSFQFNWSGFSQYSISHSDSTNNITHINPYKGLIDIFLLLYKQTATIARTMVKKYPNMLGKEISERTDAPINNIITSYNLFFNDENLSMSGLVNNALEFKKGNKSFNIRQLSDGEKTIVLFGGTIIPFRKILSLFPILFDEPDRFLHSKWQKKLLAYLRKILYDKSDINKSQFFITTHSEYIISDALKKDDILVVGFNRNENNKLKPYYYSKDIHKKRSYYILDRPSYYEIIYQVYGELSYAFFDELYSLLEEKFNTDKQEELSNIFNKYFPFKGEKNDKILNQKNGRKYFPYYLKSKIKKSCSRSILVYFRNQIHHPNNFDIKKGNGQIINQSIADDNELRELFKMAIEILNKNISENVS